MDEKLFRILKKVYYKKDYIKDEKGNKIRVKTGDVFDLKTHTGQLEQRIKKSKRIPNCEKYRLRGQLMTLAELGIMYNPFIKPLFDGFTNFNIRCEIGRKVPGSSRSDIILPLSGWRGKYGVCEERFEELFGSFYRE